LEEKAEKREGKPGFPYDNLEKEVKKNPRDRASRYKAREEKKI